MDFKESRGRKVETQKRTLDEGKTTIKICYLFLVAQLIFKFNQLCQTWKTRQIKIINKNIQYDWSHVITIGFIWQRGFTFQSHFSTFSHQKRNHHKQPRETKPNRPNIRRVGLTTLYEQLYR